MAWPQGNDLGVPAAMAFLPLTVLRLVRCLAGDLRWHVMPGALGRGSAVTWSGLVRPQESEIGSFLRRNYCGNYGNNFAVLFMLQPVMMGKICRRWWESA